MSSDNTENKEHHGHHILSNSTSRNALLFLLVFTIITVVVSMFHFGSLNFTIAMLIATAKAMVVLLYFMGLKYDNKENQVIFFGSFLFFGFFIFYTSVDLLNRRPEQRVTGPVLQASAASAVSFDDPWKPNEEILKQGEKLFKNQACYTCHGETGMGDGPAGMALGARNFHEEAGWKNGRKIHQIYKTLTEGLGSMPSYGNLPPVDRLALAQYVEHFGPVPEASTAEELLSVGIDSSKPDGGFGGAEKPKPSLPIDFAIERYVNR